MRAISRLALILVGIGLTGIWAAYAGPPAISAERLLQNTRMLSSDEFEGRAPGSHGEELTIDYLVKQFQAAGLKPGMPDGSWTQDVPIVGVKSEVDAKFAGERLTYPQDFVAWSPKQTPEVAIDERDMIFVGYGITAPEYRWNDFKDEDVRGKVIVVLINDPPIPDPIDVTKLDENMFKGNAMTYYGRWTYKFEEAARRGAAGAVIVHETKPAAYPWFVVVNSWGRERFDLAESSKPTVDIAAWISFARAQKLFADAGLSFETLKRKALSRDFKPIPLGIRASFTAKNTVRSVKSRNVLAKREGSDPKLRDEWIIYTAHWDHLGTNADQGDHIFNGAADNAIGAAGLIELGSAFAADPRPPKRSMLFLAVTAEEQGLLGTAYYAAHPPYPLNKTLADINMDGLNQWGRTRDVRVVGYGNSTLEEVLAKAAKEQHRVILPEAHPERGTFYRSDHFEFARVGIPALYAKSGDDYRDKPAGYGEQKVNEYIDKDYHKVSDEVKPDWDLSGAVEDLQLLFNVGYDVANDRHWPVWKKGAEFKKIRDDSLGHPAP
jgi:Zn-dependent M28 family amino/carboxypeptidase